MARVMLNSKKLTKRLWAEAINTACYIINRVFLRPGTSKTSYEIWKGKKPSVAYFHVFGCVCYILRDRENLGKFDAKSDEDVFIGYSTNSRAYRVYNMRTQTVMESANVVIDDARDFSEFSTEEEIERFIDEPTEKHEEACVSDTTVAMSGPSVPTNRESDETDSGQTEKKFPDIILDEVQKEPSIRVKLNHPADLILGNPEDSMVT